jgi:hypothetical protein
MYVQSNSIGRRDKDMGYMGITEQKGKLSSAAYATTRISRRSSRRFTHSADPIALGFPLCVCLYTATALQVRIYSWDSSVLRMRLLDIGDL